MLSVLVIGGFIAILGAEMYIMYNRELKKSQSEKEEHHCNCGHCHCKENKEEE